MTKTQWQRVYAMYSRLQALGFTEAECEQLRRIEMTLQRWGEMECGDSNSYCSWAIERDETTGKPFMVRHAYERGGHLGRSGTSRTPIADREQGALRRLAAIMAKHPNCLPYHQGDPRGCCLYIVPKAELKDRDINSCYTVGIAVCA